MKKQNLSDEELDQLLTDLSQSARTPIGEFSSEESSKKLKGRIPPQKAKRFHIFRYVAVASAILILSMSAYLLNSMRAPEMILFSTTDQTKGILLPDGTQVTLSHYSSLAYPSKFDGDVREVTLSGEGYFEVYKDEGHPFIVQAQDVRVKVLGTHFNVQAYSNDSEIKTTLFEGSVAVSNSQNEDILVLRPNESAVFDKQSARLFQQIDINSKDDIAWRNGNFVFNNVALSQIVQDLSNYFNIKIEISDKELKGYKLTARFENQEDVEEILALLQISGGFTWSRSPNSDQIIIKAKQTK